MTSMPLVVALTLALLAPSALAQASVTDVSAPVSHGTYASDPVGMVVAIVWHILCPVGCVAHPFVNVN